MIKKLLFAVVLGVVVMTSMAYTPPAQAAVKKWWFGSVCTIPQSCGDPNTWWFGPSDTKAQCTTYLAAFRRTPMGQVHGRSLTTCTFRTVP